MSGVNPTFLQSSQFGIANVDRLLPSQPAMCQYFSGDVSEFYAALERIVTSILPIKSVHDKWKIRLKPGVSYESLGSDLSALHMLQLIIRLCGFKRVLEVGTYIGVSTLFLADAVGDSGRVVTVEVGQEFAGIARENFRANGLESRIELINTDVTVALSDLKDDQFDLVFLDGDKGSYGELLHPLLDRLRVGGLMVVDDIFCNGDTLNAVPTTDKGAGVRELLAKVAELDGYDRVILPYGNGQLFLRKK